MISCDGSRDVMKSFYLESFYNVSNLCNISHELGFFRWKDWRLSSTWPHGLSQKYKLINHKQNILYYTRPPCDCHLIKVIGHASFASAAVFLSFLHLSPHLHALEQQRDTWTQVPCRFTQHPPFWEHPQYPNCKHTANTSSRSRH